MSSNVLGQTLRSSKSAVQKAFVATVPSSDMLRFRSPVLQTNTVSLKSKIIKWVDGFLSFQTKLARYGGRHNVTVLPGDGIGPEMINHVERILSAVQVSKKTHFWENTIENQFKAPIDFEIVNLTSKEDASEDLAEAITAIQRNGVALKVTKLSKFPNQKFNWKFR